MTPGGARYQGAALERAEEGDAGDTGRFVAQGGAAPPRQPRQILSVRRHQRLVGGDDRDAAIQRAANERERRFDAAERFDDDVNRFGKEAVGTVGDRPGQPGVRSWT